MIIMKKDYPEPSIYVPMMLELVLTPELVLLLTGSRVNNMWNRNLY